MMFSIFDIIALTIIMASTLLGIYRGFVGVMLGIIGFVVSFILAYFLYPICSDFLEEYVAQDVLLVLSSATISYIVALMIVALAKNMVAKLLSPFGGGGFIDKMLGGLSGFVRGNLISTMIFVVLAVITTGSYVKTSNLKDVATQTTKDKYPNWLATSLTIEYFEEITKQLVRLVPTVIMETPFIQEQEEDTSPLEAATKAAINKKPDVSAPDDELKKELNQILPLK